MLSKLEQPSQPKLELEQYPTPSSLVAEILNLAQLSKDIQNKKVADFCCGSGKFGIGCLLLGARRVCFVDVDEAMINLAKQNLLSLDKKFFKRAEFKVADVRKLEEEFDTIFQNPPFGLQSSLSDLDFLEASLRCAKKVYSLHGYSEKSRKFLKEFLHRRKVEIQRVIKFKFELPPLFKFHRKRKHSYWVDLYVLRARA